MRRASRVREDIIHARRRPIKEYLGDGRDPRFDLRCGMKIETLSKKLAAGLIVPLRTVQWRELEAEFEVKKRHETGIAGTLLIVRRGKLVAAVERPERGRRVIRPLPSLKAAGEFTARRMAAYDRLWDG